MTTVFEFLRSNIAADLSIALLHSLWQGVVLTLILSLVLKSIPGNRSQWRYRLSIVSLLAIVLCWLGTFSALQYKPTGDPENQAAASKAIANTGSTSTTDNDETIAVLKTVYQPSNSTTDPETEHLGFGWFIVIWSAGVLAMLGRMFAALAGTAKLKRSAVDITDNALVELFENLCVRMKITQKIRFASSETLRIPGVLGFWRPVLLIPVSILSEVPAEYLEAIIAHELANIKRYDYLINFCQMLVEAIFFFNPAVWWISRQIRIEREACCDIAGIASTGRRLGYAQVLLDQISRTAMDVRPAMTAAMTGFSDNKGTSSQERVKRIIHPQHKPHMKISWVKLMLLTGIAGCIMLGLWKTADMTIAMAAKIMTPQERVEKMAELEKSYGIPAHDPEYTGVVSEEDKVTISGTVRSWDGRKLGGYLHMTIHTDSDVASGNYSISQGSDKELPGENISTFSERCSYGTVFISAYLPGYAPEFVGPFKLGPGETKDDIELLFNEGSSATILVIDEDTREPIADVSLIGGYVFRASGYSHTINLKTDEKGVAVVEDAGDVNVTLTARVAGYQQKRFEGLMLQDDGGPVLEIKRAEAVEGVVVSGATGQHVANAVVRTQMAMGKNQMSWGRDRGKVIATSDEHGRFVLDQLADDTTYKFSVKADGYAYAFTDVISAGQGDIEVRLIDEIVIKGRVEGPVDKLPIKDGKSYVPYKGVFRWENRSNVEMTQSAFVRFEGEEVLFYLTDMWGTKVNVGLDHWRKSILLDESLPDEIVLDLNEPVNDDGIEYHKRQLVLEFEVPKGLPLPTGNIRLNYMAPKHSRTTYKGKLVEIIDGRAEAEIVAPGKIAYKVADTIGYWFKGTSEVKVDEGTEPLVIRVAVIPAGMIFGQVYEADKTPASNTMVGYNIVTSSPLLDKDTHFLGVDGKNSSSQSEMETKYSIDPLPLGGVYRIIAHRKDSYAVSERIELTEENPIREINLTFSEGVTVSGQILTPDGGPAGSIQCNLSFDVADGHGFGTQDRYTDSQGRFKFEHVNPDAAGKYRIEIKNDRDYRPVQIKLKKKYLVKPFEVILEQGAIARGQIVDKKTGWPIPSVEVRAYYHFYNKDNSVYELVLAEAKTDKNGQFRFSNMKQDREYVLIATGCKDNDPIIIAGRAENQVFEVEIYEWSQLKPRKPDEAD